MSKGDYVYQQGGDSSCCWEGGASTVVDMDMAMGHRGVGEGRRSREEDEDSMDTQEQVIKQSLDCQIGERTYWQVREDEHLNLGQHRHQQGGEARFLRGTDNILAKRRDWCLESLPIMCKTYLNLY